MMLVDEYGVEAGRALLLGEEAVGIQHWVVDGELVVDAAVLGLGDEVVDLGAIEKVNSGEQCRGKEEDSGGDNLEHCCGLHCVPPRGVYGLESIGVEGSVQWRLDSRQGMLATVGWQRSSNEAGPGCSYVRIFTTVTEVNLVDPQTTDLGARHYCADRSMVRIEMGHSFAIATPFFDQWFS